MTKQQLQKDFEKAQTAHKQVSLSMSEKIALKNRIFAEVEKSAAVVGAPRAVPSPFMSWSFYMRAVPIALLICVVVGAPVAFAAEKSLPGDALYSIKTGVNEEVAAVFVPAQEKDEYYQTLLTKRAGELQVLMHRGELSDERLVSFEEALEHNVHVAIESSAASEESPEEILQDHQTIVETLELSAAGFGLVEEDADSSVSASMMVEDTEIAGIPVSKMVVMELDVKDAPDTSTATAPVVSAEKMALQKKFGDLRQVAVAAFMDRVAEVSDNGAVETRAVVEGLVEDAQEKVDAIVREDKADVEPDPVIAEIEDAENEALVLEVEAAATTVTATSSVGIVELEQVLELHERLSRKKIEQAVERLLEEAGEGDEVPVEIPAAKPEAEATLQASTTVSVSL